MYEDKFEHVEKVFLRVQLYWTCMLCGLQWKLSYDLSQPQLNQIFSCHIYNYKWNDM